MLLSPKFRRVLQSSLKIFLLATTSLALAGPPGGGHRGSGPQPTHSIQNQGRQEPRGQNQEHLEQWMDRHSNLPLAEQQRSLENEPGFRQLPPETQQRMRDRLTQLTNMPPEQRRRTIERTETMEHLTAPQRQQVRGAMQQLGELPVDRRRLVARVFRDLREMPPQQRAAFLASDQLRGQFSDHERNTLSSLLAVEPYLPPKRPEDGSQSIK